MSYHPEDRITRKDAAALARKSEDTIRRAEKKHDLAVETDPGTGQVTYRVGDLVDLDLIRITDVAIAGTAAESAEVIKARAALSELQAAVAEQRGRLAHADALVAELTRQLEVKDRQLAGYATEVVGVRLLAHQDHVVAPSRALDRRVGVGVEDDLADGRSR